MSIMREQPLLDLMPAVLLLEEEAEAHRILTGHEVLIQIRSNSDIRVKCLTCANSPLAS